MSLTQRVDDGFDALRTAIDIAVRQALDTDEFRRAIDAVVKQALDNDGFHECGAVRQLLADAAGKARRVIVEAVGFDEVVTGAPGSLCAVQQVSSSVGVVIDAVVREAFSRREEI